MVRRVQYERLERQLVADGRERIELTFAEIERIIGERLPPSARRYQAWWATDQRHTQTVWLDAGYHARPDLTAERVVFSRRESRVKPAHEAPAGPPTRPERAAPAVRREPVRTEYPAAAREPSRMSPGGTVARPALFIGSSREGLPIARFLQLELDHVCEVELWTQGVFGLTRGTLESLVAALPRFDFAVLVLTADDLSVTRGVRRPAARDNVIFELGLFIGALGRERTFLLYDRTHPPALPSDLAGVTPVTFAPHANGNLRAALGAAGTQIQWEVERHGPRPR